ncbi:MAG: M15 family metallopeptidase, partial [Pseudomonadota bacterium]
MLRELHDELGIPADYEATTGLPAFDEARVLADAGQDIIGRKLELAPDALAAWRSMTAAAAAEDVSLLPVSGFRSYDYQARVIRKKLNAGQSIEQILCVNAAPGFSEHHTGRAIDIASPGSRPLTEEFELSQGFTWLEAHAGRFGFRLSYPRDNPHGIAYEP